MYATPINHTGNMNFMPVLNKNRITDVNRREAIKAMGMSACQARCLSCSHCSHHCGK